MKKSITIFFTAILPLTVFTGYLPDQVIMTLPETPSQPVEQDIVKRKVKSSKPTTPINTIRIFKDSVGRNVEVPQNITKIAVSGPLAQIVLFALVPDKLVGIAKEWDSTAEQFINPKYYNLPVLGQLYRGKNGLNLETLLASGAQVVVDIGKPRDTVAEDLDGLQHQTGIPFVHITAMTETMGDAYSTLGDLLGMKDKADILENYCNEMYNKIIDIANSVDKSNLLYCLGDTGLNVIAKGSYHAEIIDMLSNNLAVVDYPSTKGLGNEVDMEQILLWNPDVILFAPGSIFAVVGGDKTWQRVKAIANGTYYEAPSGPYNWMGFPSSVQRYLGMIWMAELLYPETAQYDLYSEVSRYFKLFYHCEITREQYNKLVINSIRTENGNKKEEIK